MENPINTTSLEREYGCTNTKNSLEVELTDDFTVIRNQADFTNQVTGNCIPDIDFTNYDLIIGKKGLTSGNSSIDYQFTDDCRTGEYVLKVIFSQNIATVAPNITYHRLIPKLPEAKEIKVLTEVKYAEINCELFDTAFPLLFIRLVDSSGNNLIENETIDPNNVSVEGDFPRADFEFVPADEFANPDAYIRALDNSLRLFLPNEATFQYVIHLDDLDKTIKVDFTAELTKIPCDLSYFKPIEGSYNDETLKLKEVPPLQFVAVLEI